MGLPEHPVTDIKMYAFMGELISTQGYLVKIPNNSFNIIWCTVLPDVGLFRGLLTADPHAATVGPFVEGGPHMAVTCTQYLVPLPHKY